MSEAFSSCKRLHPQKMTWGRGGDSLLRAHGLGYIKFFMQIIAGKLSLTERERLDV